MRVVLDTNVLVSAFVFPGGPPETVYRRVLSSELTMIVSRPLLAELGRVMVDKFNWEATYTEEVLAQLIRLGDLVEPAEMIEDIVDDPADDRVLEAAAEGHADFIVSGAATSSGSFRGARSPSWTLPGSRTRPDVAVASS